ncbi:MAG: aspartate carbamoyltransferase catalytic subunit [Synergistaceae bacterium]|jgi:aspartate carbamoyltransferase catalytic subunit|nr:aspartate carbamoyltransferase catalytic subunit [Synergistaceae bacterium]
MSWRRKHLIDVDDWEREDFELLLEQTSNMDSILDRSIKKAPALRGKIVVNIFYEPSTRTRTSFEIAGKLLSADVINWTASGSSAAKGESLRDTIWTLEAMGADAVVIRHGEVGVPYYLAEKLKKASVINGGDGTHAHPTQALLDLYTAWRELGSLDGKKVAIVGDILHSRVARSDIYAFKAMGAEVYLSGPSTLMPTDINSLNAMYEPNIAEAIEGADIVYMLRIQRERQDAGLFPSLDEYHRRYGLTDKLLGKAKKGALVMHPGPINRGVEIASSVADGPQSFVLKQARAGVAVRMALLYLMLGGVKE